MAFLLQSNLGAGLVAWAELFTKLEAGEEISVTVTRDSPLLFQMPWEDRS
jgi:hypothetical protein